MTEYSFYNCIR